MTKKQEPLLKYCRAIVCEGRLRWEYQVDAPGVPMGRDSFDLDVSDWSEQDIIKTTRSYLNMEPGETVEVIYD